MISRIAKAFGMMDKTKYRATSSVADASQYNFTAINMRFNKVKGFFKEAIVDGERHVSKI